MSRPPQEKPVNQALIKYKARNLILESKNLFQELFFTWVSPVISYGAKTVLEQEAVPDLPERLLSVHESKMLKEKVEEQFGNNIKNRQGVKLLKAVAKSSKSYVFPLLFGYLITCLCNIALPILTNKVIGYIEAGNMKVSTSLMFVGLVFLVKFSKNLSLTNLCYNMAVFGFNLSNNLGICIFQKALKFPTLCNKSVTIAELINYTEVDAQRMSDIGWNASSLIFSPTVLVVGIVLMYSYIGVAFVSGMGVMIVISVLVYFLTKYQTRANDTLLVAKDERMKVTNQIFNQIRFIKANAWEKYYFNKLNRARNDELGKIKKVNLFNVLEILFMWLAIPLSVSATFGTYVFMGHQLTAQVAFTTIVLFNMLEFPMNALPSAISQLSQTWSSIKRIQKFLMAEQISTSYIKEDEDLGDTAIRMNNGTFYWERQDDKKEDQNDKDKKKGKKDKKGKKKSEPLPEDESETESQIKQSLLSESSFQNEEKMPKLYVKALKGINTEIKKGKLTIVLGSIGSGKSSLLYSILGEMKPFPKSMAAISIDGSVAFVPQKSWMMSRSVEQNILMTTQKDQGLFDKAIKYSCLQDDIKQFQDGVKTIVGEKGINLSGGQKARVSLARALYLDKDIYLLDDIISAVDVHVGNFIIKECILDYLKGKTVVLVTHAVAFAKYADEIIIMKKGQVVGKGKYQELKENAYFKEIQELESKKQNQKDQDSSEDAPGQMQGALPQLIHQKTSEKEQPVKQTETNKLVQELLMPEDRSRGKVEWKTYLTYINLNGGWPFVVVLLLAMCFYASLSLLGSLQIEKWCQHPQQGFKDLYLYMGFAIMSGLFAAARAVILIFSGIKQGSIAHKKMMKGLMYASIPEFFDRVPTGRILNRVSKDLRELDENIGYKVGGVLVSTFSLLVSVAICVYASTPYILIPVVVFLGICWFYKGYFMKTQREIVRLETISNSPVISSFTEVVNGLPSVRAYKLAPNFFQRQCNLVDVNKQNKVCRQAVECWFAERLGFLSFFINITAVVYCLFVNNQNPSLVGLLLAYAFQIDESIIWLTYSSAELEGKMVSVERVSNFMSIQSEKGYVQYTKKWRTKDEDIDKVVAKGKVEFKQFSLRYRQNLPLVLKSLNLCIRGGEKIGVVGRTGAGKSTIIQALLRVIEASQGQILIDGQNITNFSLKAFRTSVTLIPQEPVLIAGTLRENLDPRNEHSDEKLLSSLEKCYLMETFKERELLETKISESGENLSIGQKQLICIARAILRQNKLVLIDQATANIDMKSDKLIQQTIRNCFSESTVITIAHRIKTILDSDRILVMDKGRVGEFDTPERLLQMKGIFSEMYEKSREENEL